MKNYENRVLQEAKYITKNKTTIRDAASEFGVCKSTIHRDMIIKLPTLNEKLAKEVRDILNFNKEERHLRGGEATKNKYFS